MSSIPSLGPVTTLPIGAVTPYEGNPRTIGEDAVDAVARSLREYGWQQPIVVDTEHVIIAGHTRLRAAQTLGLTEVPVVVADQLTAEQAQAYRIADNRVGELAVWDDRLLLEQLEGLDDDLFTGFYESDPFEDVNLDADLLGSSGEEGAEAATFTLRVHSSSREHLDELLAQIRPHLREDERAGIG